jgi:hypothetical protein
VANLAGGELLCFPSDDSYYMPGFAEKMIYAAETGRDCSRFGGINKGPLDLVCCDFVWGRTWEGKTSWTYCDGGPQVCHIDKTTFISRADWFARIGWPIDTSGGDARDGLFAERMVAMGARVGRVVEVLAVHNP